MNFRVTSGDQLQGWEDCLRFEEMDGLWGKDPVHLSPSGYKKMAKAIVELGLFTTPFTNYKPVGGPDRSQQRPAWVRGNRNIVGLRSSPTPKDGRGLFNARGGYKLQGGSRPKGGQGHKGSWRSRGHW